MAKTKKTEQAAATVVYCGPTIPGVAKQFTFYRGGIPAPLAEAIQKNPSMGGLVIPLDQLPEAMKKLHGGYGHIYRLYRMVQAKN
jgi:hypothetical protein